MKPVSLALSVPERMFELLTKLRHTLQQLPELQLIVG